MTGVSDEELVSRCLEAGQSYDAAFQALYERHSPRVFGFLLKLTQSRSAAEDALQETFLRVYKSLERFDTQRDLGAWLLQIARYVAIDAFRVERKVKRLEERRASEEREAHQTNESVAEQSELEQVWREDRAAAKSLAEARARYQSFQNGHEEEA